jgi:2',3'-cyclic-nucleotide 2'-phosphodiesterase (5'-nucleotidase family)
MKKIRFLLAALLLAGVCYAKPKSIVILYENDVHCAIDGYQTLAGLRDAMADTAYVAVVGSGDFVQGGTAGAISKGRYVADIMREVGYDAITLGNHEFDFPVAHVAGLLEYIGAPVVSANFRDRNGQCVYAPYLIKRFGRTKIAFIGATTPTTLYTETGAFMDGEEQVYDLSEKTFYSVMQNAVNQARKQGAKYVVLLSHVSEEENETGITSHTLVEHTTGIDIVLDGHSHKVVPHDTILNAAGKPVVITQTGTQFAYIGKLLIRKGKMSNELLPFNTLTQRNERVRWVTDSINELIREQTQRVVCHSDVALQFEQDGLWIPRTQETNTGDLLCDAYRTVSGADIALANGGGVRKGQTAGDWTYGDIAAMLPYDNHLWTVEATGATIIELLQQNTALLPKEDGSFPQVSGLRFTVHVADRTVSDVEVLNKQTNEYEPIDPDKIYTVATIDYCVTGGGFRDVLKPCKIIQRGDVLYRDILVEYLEKTLSGHVSNDYAEPQGRIKIIY